MIQTPTFEDLVNSCISNLQATIPELSTTPLSVVRETLINPPSTQLAFMFDLAKRISVIQDIFKATGSDLDALAATYGVTRKGGTAASGTIYLDLTNLETSQTIVLNSGTTVRPRTDGSFGITFRVTATYTFSIINRALYEATANTIRSELDSIGLTNVRLVSPVTIQCNTTGSAGVIGAYTLTRINAPGINAVVNISSTSGGLDAEGDDSLRQRIIAIFTGNSVGTEGSLLAAATSPNAITNAFMVRFGDPLMTRDGSVYDKNGVLITPGTGRAVDIYVQGKSLSTNTDKPLFQLTNTENFLSSENGILIAQPTNNTFGMLPIEQIINITGSESAAIFSQGTSVTDSEGNVIIEGNFALIKDTEANNYSIIENLITKERKLATKVNPSTTTYTIIETLKSSDYAGSCFSQDKVLFLKDTVDIVDESVNKGQYNGSDQLRYTNVSSTKEIYEEKTIIETLEVTELLEVSGGVAIQLKHYPIIQINSVFHSRLGINIGFELTDPQAGIVKLIGRTPPRQGDLLKFELVWKKQYNQNLEYNLVGDLIDWISPTDEKQTTGSELLPEEDLLSENIIATQPNIPTHLEIQMSGMSDREIIKTTISGNKVDIVNDRIALQTSNQFEFAMTGIDSIGKIFNVTNTTKGYNYNLAGYQLKTNKLDSRAGVDTSLLPEQFRLGSSANIDPVSPGDKVVLGSPSKTLSWSTEPDFTNNIETNISPVYDPTTIDFTSGGIVLKNSLQDTTLDVTTLSGSITKSTTLSGIVELIGNLLIGEGVVVDIEPNTIIKAIPTNQFQNQVQFSQDVIFSSTLTQQQTLGNYPIASEFEEFYYIYFKPENFNSNFFTIINDEGQTLAIRFNSDILQKTIINNQTMFYVGGRAVNSSFNQDIENTLDLLNTTTSIKASLIGGRFGVDGISKFTAAQIPSKNQYITLLEKNPITTANTQADFTLAVQADPFVTFSRFSYDSTINALVVDGNILQIDGYGDTTSSTDYVITHFIEEKVRISIVVDGTLRILGATTETSVLFTSSSDAAAAGDWEGIIFTPKSHTSNSRTLFQSDISNARIRYANVGISIQSSDANVQNCIIRDCLFSGINVFSKNQSIAQYTTTDFYLTSVSNPLEKFISETRLTFSETDDVRVARYKIPDNLVSNFGNIPPVKLKLTETSYITDLVEGLDYTIFVENQRVTSIDTNIPKDGYADYSLEDQKDFMIEYDINSGYTLVFLYTAGSTKRKNVYNLITDLASKSITGKITVDYYNSVTNGVIYNNLIINTDVGISLSSLATTSINRNTINNTRLGIQVVQSICEIQNNLITGYSIPLAFDNGSLIRVIQNDIYSKKIVDLEQVGASDYDLLLKNIGPLTSTLLVKTPGKFKVGGMIKIDNESMLVQGTTDSSIIVARGQENTDYIGHSSGSQITILQTNNIFTVTGIPGDSCKLIETDSSGAQLPTTIPLSMKLVAPNTFRIAFPVNRRANFYYKYTYGNINQLETTSTLTKVFPKDQMGVGVNDVINVLHEISILTNTYVPNNKNYSADPLYTNEPAADFTFSELTSLASKYNPLYGSLIAPSPSHRYVGSISINRSNILNTGDTRIPVPYEPLIIENFNEILVTGEDGLNQGIKLTVKGFSYSITPAEADLGAVGVFILNEQTHPTGVIVAGSYSIQYNSPINLGSNLIPYYIQSNISYVVDAGSQVTFNDLIFHKDNIGGLIEFSFKVASSMSELANVATGTTASTSPIIIEQYTTTNIGNVIQINVFIKGNDSSFNQSTYLFPILEDFTLNYLPAKDATEYKVLSLIKNSAQNQTNILIDKPISNNTYSTVGMNAELDLFVRKKSNNFDPAQEILIASARGVSIGDTYISAMGDLTLSKPAPVAGDIVRVNFLSYSTGEETLVFIQDGSEITQNIYSQITKIQSSVTIDKQSIILPNNEKIIINQLNQPSSGDLYKASYSFEAPINGEMLTVSYSYNAAIRSSSEAVESKKSIFTDVLIKQVKDVLVRIGISLDVKQGIAPLSVQSQVGDAITKLFETTMADLQSERRLDESDIIRSTGNIAGIETISVTTLSRNLITGEVQSPIIFEPRENAMLEEKSPRITTTQAGKIVSN